MTTVFALLVGIDRYAAAPDLHGCENDVADVEASLDRYLATGSKVEIRRLLNGEATRAAVIDGLRYHLGQAAEGDTALFWFSGHGSTAPLPPEIWFLERGRSMQTLVCADSRVGDVPDLFDKELWLLLNQVARTGAHVLTVLDSCHSGGAARDGNPADGTVRTRMARHLDTPPRLDALIPELVREAVATHGPTDAFVALTACRAFETAQERYLSGKPRGLFTWSVLRAMRRLGRDATYRAVHLAARCDVEQWAGRQVPQLSPATGSLPDTLFLGGVVAPRPSDIHLLHHPASWRLNVGALHGLSDVTPGENIRFAVFGSVPLREVAVTAVAAEHCTVEPLGWQPDLDRQYPMVVSTYACSPTLVVVPEPADAVAQVVSALTASVVAQGLAPRLRIASSTETTGNGYLSLSAAAPDAVRICDADGRRLLADLPCRNGSDAHAIVDALAHIARWRTIRSLANPVSTLDGAVSVTFSVAEHGTPPRHDAAVLHPGPSGAIELDYGRTSSGLRAPTVHIALRNSTNRRMYCALVDLTDQFGAHADLFAGEAIEAGQTGVALHGKPVEFRFPDDRFPVAGTFTTDWLLLVVSDREFGVQPFEQTALGDQPTHRSRPASGPYSVFDRILGREAGSRTAGSAREDPAVGDWCTALIPVVTRAV